MKQSNHHFSYTIAVKASAAEVWRVLTDAPGWHRWDTEILEATLAGDFAAGTSGTMRPKKGPVLKFYISEVIPNQSYTFCTILPVGELVIKRSLSVGKNETHFTDDIAFTGFLKYFFGLLLGSQFRKVLPGVMNSFKKIVERG